MSILEVLQELTQTVRLLAGHIVALEARSPSWDALPADVVTQLERLEQRLAKEADDPNPWTELERRIAALEARMSGLAARNAQRKARGQSLREAIADILRQAPGATGPDVLARLRETHTEKLPSLRTVRWHLAHMRGNGNTRVLPPPASRWPASCLLICESEGTKCAAATARTQAGGAGGARSSGH